jgi:hypothetical protein
MFCFRNVCLVFFQHSWTNIFFYGKILKIKHTCDDFTFLVVNFHSISSNIPAAPAYRVYISQLMHYVMACTQYRVIFLTEMQY